MSAIALEPTAAKPQPFAGRSWSAPLRKLIVECAGAPCRRFTVSHRLLRRDGIRLNGAWYCSADCFTDALSRLGVATVETGWGSPRALRVPVRHILLRRGVVSEETLRQALATAADRSCRVEDVLLSEGAVSEAQVSAARAEALGLPFFASRTPELPAAAWLPRPLMERYTVASVGISAGTLLIGFAGEVRQAILTATAAVTGVCTRPCVITAAAYEQALLQAPDPGAGSMALPWAEAAARLLACAVDTGAEEVCTAYAADWLWARCSSREFKDQFFQVHREDQPERDR